jgi:hypothetical protein
MPCDRAIDETTTGDGPAGHLVAGHGRPAMGYLRRGLVGQACGGLVGTERARRTPRPRSRPSPRRVIAMSACRGTCTFGNSAATVMRACALRLPTSPELLFSLVFSRGEISMATVFVVKNKIRWGSHNWPNRSI